MNRTFNISSVAHHTDDMVKCTEQHGLSSLLPSVMQFIGLDHLCGVPLKQQKQIL